FSYIYYLSGNRTISEEICQDVFLKVYLKINKFEGRSSFKTWLYKIAKNTALEFFRKNSREVLVYEEGNWEEKLVDRSSNPEESLMNKEKGQYIQKTLQMMSEKYRTYIILRDFQNMSYQEISEITDTNLNTVKVNIYRARDEFRRIYKELEGK
ncbi:MAG: polymerase subunit sigma-24, partial [Clostridia bacterium]|nr:polymerase subunit sigma-24 [Clostridia bacterium]